MSPKLCLKLAFVLVLCSVLPALTSAQVATIPWASARRPLFLSA